MQRHVPTRPNLAVAGGLLLLALWHGGSLWAIDRGIRNVEAHATMTPPTPTAEEPWRAMRFFGDPDAYYWLAYARDLRASGHFRVRRTVADNAPYGREVHWAQLPIWSLAGLSALYERLGGLPAPLALEWAGRTLMPLLGFVFFSAVLWLLKSRLDPPARLLAVLAMACTCHYEFHPLRPDHHGFQIAFATGCLIFLLRGGLGWVRRADGGGATSRLLPPPAAARREFVAAGVCAGLALWLGATVFAFILLAMAAGLALNLLLAGGETPEHARPEPDLFRWWGATGAATALLLYAVEYAPHHFAMRLEVNHPLYALWFLGTAECLRALARWKTNRGAFRFRDGLCAGLGFWAAASLPLLVLFGPAAWYLPRAALLLRLHARVITEFLSPLQPNAIGVYLRDPLLAQGVLALGCALFLLGGRRLPFEYRGFLRVLAVATGGVFLLFCWQGRWVQFLPPFFLLLAAVGLTALRQPNARLAPRARLPLTALLTIMLLLQTAQAARVHVRLASRMLRVEQMDALWNRYMLQRNMLLQLKTVSNGRPLRLVLPVEMAPAAYYFGVGDSIGSLYWENLAGLTAASEFLAAPMPGARAREIARERAITHVVSLRTPEEAAMSCFLLAGRDDPATTAATLGYAMAQGGTGLPDWTAPDYDLLVAASQPYYIYVPGIGRWITEKASGWIYRLQP